MILKEKLNIPQEKKVICYLGSIGGWYMIDEMLRFYKLLKEKRDYIFLILTKEHPSLVEAEAKKAGINIEDLRITYSSRSELPLYLSLCTSSIFFIRNSFSKIASSPTKLGELMGMGIPVICNSIGDTEYIIKKTGAGLLLNAFDDQTISKQLLNMDIIESMPEDQIRKGAFEFFDLQTGIEKYKELYNSIFEHAEA